MCTFYYSGKHCFENMNMADFLFQITFSPLRHWRDKDRNTGIQVPLDDGICSEEENVSGKSLLSCLHPHTFLIPLSSVVCDPTGTCH